VLLRLPICDCRMPIEEIPATAVHAIGNRQSTIGNLNPLPAYRRGKTGAPTVRVPTMAQHEPLTHLVQIIPAESKYCFRPGRTPGPTRRGVIKAARPPCRTQIALVRRSSYGFYNYDTSSQTPST
jgi:hypothetical protein